MMISRVPALKPTPEGMKEALMVQMPFTANGDVETQLSVSEKSPIVPTTSTLIGPLLTLVSVSDWEELVVPVAWLPKVSDEGEAVNRGGATVTRILTRTLCCPRAYVAVISAFPSPTEVAVPAESTVTTFGLDEENVR